MPRHAVMIVIDRDRFRLVVWRPGVGDKAPTVAHHCPVAVGMEGFATPRGAMKTGPRTRTPDWRAPDWVEPPLTPQMLYPFDAVDNPYRVGLISLHGMNSKGESYDGYAIHGTSNPNSIPGRASHGCVRLRDADIDLLYKNLPDQTLVIIC